jgi:hypothetical protein
MGGVAGERAGERAGEPVGEPVGDGDQRLARNLGELLQELRVAQTGVQVLLGFLLSVIFTEPYRRAGLFVHVVHVATVMSAAGAVAFMIAPAAWHRLLFRQGRRELIVERASRFAVVGLVLLACAVVGTVLLVGYVVFGAVAGAVLGGVIAVLFGLLWFVVPLHAR